MKKSLYGYTEMLSLAVTVLLLLFILGCAKDSLPVASNNLSKDDRDPNRIDKSMFYETQDNIGLLITPLGTDDKIIGRQIDFGIWSQTVSQWGYISPYYDNSNLTLGDRYLTPLKGNYEFRLRNPWFIGNAVYDNTCQTWWLIAQITKNSIVMAQDSVFVPIGASGTVDLTYADYLLDGDTIQFHLVCSGMTNASCLPKLNRLFLEQTIHY